MRNVMWRLATLLGAITISCHGSVQQGRTGSSQAVNSPAVAELERARAALDHPVEGGVIGKISLAGYSFSREVTIGGGLRVIAISCNLGGGLAIFGSDGALITTRRTNEITTVELFDVDEDDRAEVMTEEVDARGTGILEKAFHLYRVAGKDVREIWRGESYKRHANGDSAVIETLGFVRFDPSGDGRPARLTYIVANRTSRVQEEVFEWRDRALALVKK